MGGNLREEKPKGASGKATELGALEKVDRQMRIEWQLIEGIERAHDLVMPQAREVLVHGARCERHDPSPWRQRKDRAQDSPS